MSSILEYAEGKTDSSDTSMYFYYSLVPPPRYPSGRVLASSARGPGFNSQSKTASYKRRYKNGTSSSFV